MVNHCRCYQTWRIIQIEGELCVIQVFEGTRGISLEHTYQAPGKPFKMPLSMELLGRVMDGKGRPVDGLGEIHLKS